MTLPARLLELYEANKEDPSSLNRHSLWMRLVDSARSDPVPHDIDSRVQLARIWLDCNASIMHESHQFYISETEIGAMTQLLTCKESVTRIVNNDEHARLLAFICAAPVATNEAGAEPKGMKSLIEMLALWTDRELADDESISFEKTIELLYGPLTYTLYRPEVNSDTELASHLYRESVPLLRARTHLTMNRLVTNVDMPDSLVNLDI